jgi:hypothetical protein
MAIIVVPPVAQLLESAKPVYFLGFAFLLTVVADRLWQRRQQKEYGVPWAEVSPPTRWLRGMAQFKGLLGIALLLSTVWWILSNFWPGV